MRETTFPRPPKIDDSTTMNYGKKKICIEIIEIIVNVLPFKSMGSIYPSLEVVLQEMI